MNFENGCEMQSQVDGLGASFQIARLPASRPLKSLRGLVVVCAHGPTTQDAEAVSS